jgi:hypothetical protein
MSFLPAVQREITNRPANDSVRLTLEYLIQHGMGHLHPVPLRQIVEYLNDNGIQISGTGFQQTVLAESRSRDFYIGVGRRGYFIIDTIDDAILTRDFYNTRIQAEQRNLDNLRQQATSDGLSKTG